MSLGERLSTFTVLLTRSIHSILPSSFLWDIRYFALSGFLRDYQYLFFALCNAASRLN